MGVSALLSTGYGLWATGSDAPPPVIVTRAASDPLGTTFPTLQASVATLPNKAVHTVRLGDSLRTLALLYYDDPAKADLIYAANRRLLTDGPYITVGQILRIPELSNL